MRLTMAGLPVLLLATLCLASGTLAKKGFGPGEQEWGHVNVRPDANMFWWLYYTTANVSSYYEKPLIIWLQGGPGGSSTSFGNFEELGPLDVHLTPRNYSWVKDYNVLFIDNPVGTGFSYTTSTSAYAMTNAQIASDLVECMRDFLKKLPGFAKVPTYITTESYGGKMGAEFALVWDKEQKAGTINSNLRGVALGDAWISPIDSVMTWAPYLLATGMVDTAGYKTIQDAAQKTQDAVEAGEWRTSTKLWGQTESVIAKMTDNIDFYNILTKIKSNDVSYSLAGRTVSKLPFHIAKPIGGQDDVDLGNLMNGPVKEALGLSVKHNKQADTVFEMLAGDFMKPVIDKVELLLNQTDLKVVVLTGQLDLIVDTPGTLKWVEEMRWTQADAWLNSSRLPLSSHGVIEGFVKSYSNFSVYWVNRAGHMVPKDNPAAMAQILKRLTA